MSSPSVSSAAKSGGDASSQGVDAPLIEVFGLLVEAHARLVAELDRELLESRGVSLQSFEVLIRLARTPSASLSAGELARAVALSSGGATRLIDRLEATGLVARRTDARDRRVVRVDLTAEGRDVLHAALAVHLDGLERHLAGPLAPNELAALENAVRSVRDGFDPTIAHDRRRLGDATTTDR